MKDNSILTLRNLTKTFAGVCALKDVSFSIQRGEVRALMGENGAGKSTLIKIITGLYHADGGTMEFDGKEHAFTGVLEAQRAGISTVFQELNMIPYLTVSENIFLGRYPCRNGGIDWKAMHAQAQQLVDGLGADIDVRKPLNAYSTAKQQIISIIRAVNFESKLIILDEPTSSLDTNEVEILFGIMDQLKARGTSILFISHRIDEVYRKCDSITVLKDGEHVGTYPARELPQYELLTKMLGRKDVELKRLRPAREYGGAETVLEARSLSRLPAVKDVSFSVRRGEILGLAGLLGSGRTETARLLFGCDPMEGGALYMHGKQISVRSPQDAVKNGMAFCTENRREEGIFPDITVQNNIAVCSLKSLTRHGLIRSRLKKALSAEYIQKLRVKTASDQQLIRNLSGGNQQKVILSRWMATHPELIILDEPTRGIDVGAKAEIEKIIQELSDSGVSVLFISSEMMELVRNCDRVLVLRDGCVVGELTGDQISEEAMMRAIAAGGGEEAERRDAHA